MLSQVVFFGLIAAGIPLWIRILQSLQRGKPPLEPRLRIQSPFGLVDIGIMFVCWFMSQIIALGVSMLWMGVSIFQLDTMALENEITLLVIISVSQLLFTILGTGIIAVRYGHAPRIFGWQPEHLPADLRIGTLVFFAIAPVIMTIQLVLTQYVEYSHTTLSLLEENPTAAGIAAAWFMAVLVAPATEEIFFRGVLQSWLQRQTFFSLDISPEQIFGGWTRYGFNRPAETNTDVDTETVTDTALGMSQGEQAYRPIKVYSDLPDQSRLAWTPIFISALVFGGVHFGQGPAPIPLFFFGLALGYVYRQTGSTLCCIVMHMLLNGITMFLVTADALYQTG
jgi:membrane protease YdiL (CAAX protease family)